MSLSENQGRFCQEISTFSQEISPFSAADVIKSLIENISRADLELLSVELTTVAGILNKPGPEQLIASLRRTS